jgi:ribosomal protein L12E/L44/L45/RPP1/RPP2
MQNYLLKIWSLDTMDLKKEILFSSTNNVTAAQQASAATPDNCRASYEEITKEENEKNNKQETKETEEAF